MELLPASVVQHDLPHEIDIRGQREDDNSVVLVAVRRAGEHVVEDTLHIVEVEQHGCLYIICTATAKQCCSSAPQEDPRFMLFQLGSCITKCSRDVLPSVRTCRPNQANDALSRASSQQSASPPADAECDSQQSVEPSAVHPTPAGLEVTGAPPLLPTFARGFRQMMHNGDDFKLAIQLCRFDGESKPSLLSLWRRYALEKDDATAVYSKMHNATKGNAKTSRYLHWVVSFMNLALLQFEVVDKGLVVQSGDLKRQARKASRVIQLLAPFGMAGLLILTVFGHATTSFYSICKASDEDWVGLKDGLEWTLRSVLPYIAQRLEGSRALRRVVPIFHPVSFCIWYRYQMEGQLLAYEYVSSTFGASDRAFSCMELFTDMMLGELLESMPIGDERADTPCPFQSRVVELLDPILTKAADRPYDPVRDVSIRRESEPSRRGWTTPVINGSHDNIMHGNHMPECNSAPDLNLESMTWSGGSAAENAAHAGDSGGEWTGAAAGQKRPQVEDSPTSKRHRPSAAETTANSNTVEGSNADPASISYTAPRDDATSGIFSDIANPQLEFSSEYWDAVLLDGISATSGMVYNGGDSMADGIPATYGMAHTDMPISNDFQIVDFCENAATFPSFLSEPQPNGTVLPAEERETQPPAIQDRS
ncbi:hypothetical protein BBO_09271 [Beauveria brongniartii RCEF 3172]|uniref:Uncharacterized protein n=1 Tax=Beauveria brongniartii RCEF 3172 TaxID=1081107 RepID=A0A166W1W6_9HYPO|nr:hypothetical protein BBO_09271 [Beauveria brongniartii RCEF 3172]